MPLFCSGHGPAPDTQHRRGSGGGAERRWFRGSAGHARELFMVLQPQYPVPPLLGHRGGLGGWAGAERSGHDRARCPSARCCRPSAAAGTRKGPGGVGPRPCSPGAPAPLPRGRVTRTALFLLPHPAGQRPGASLLRG